MEKTIVLGGGCFWCTEAVFNEISGILKVESGYSGGRTKNPLYNEVCSGDTGHAEVVMITYDPNIISLDTVIKIHLATHDPTTLNRQGADEGTQYRSVIFYQNDTEKVIIQKEIEKASGEYSRPIVTEVKPLDQFYPAETHHQSYYASHKNQTYCQIVISPKLSKMRSTFKDLLRKS